MRDRELEDRFLDQIVELAARVEYTQNTAFPATVLARLERGESEHHETWAERDWRVLLAEAGEETADFPAWLILFLQRVQPLVPASDWQTLYMLAVRAATHAAAADAVWRELYQETQEMLDL
jgi:hypothetical protein